MNKRQQRRFYLGKNIVVYGATGGLGEALCFALYGQVAQLVLAGRSPEKLEALRQRLETQPDYVTTTALKVWIISGTNAESMAAFAEQIRENAADGLIIATGKTFYQEFCGHAENQGGQIAQQSWQGYQELLEVNLAGVLQLALELLCYFRQRRGFLHIAGSYTCIFPVPYQAVYSASKAALLSFVQAVAREQEAEFGAAQVRGLLSISLIGGMATNMYYQSDLHRQFARLESLMIAAPQKIAVSLLRGIAQGNQIITVGLGGFLIYHWVRRLPTRWLSYGLLRAYRPKNKDKN